MKFRELKQDKKIDHTCRNFDILKHQILNTDAFDEIAILAEKICRHYGFGYYFFMDSDRLAELNGSPEIHVSNLPKELVAETEVFKIIRSKLNTHFESSIDPLICEIENFYSDQKEEQTKTNIGLFFSVHSADNRIVFVGFINGETVLPIQQVLELHHLSVWVLEKILSSVQAKINFRPNLTNLEIEYLRQIAAGVTKVEISDRKVAIFSKDLLAATLSKKLGAKNLTHAVAIALRAKIIR